MKVVEPKALAEECGLQGYSRLKKAELITFLQNNLQPTRTPQMSTWEPASRTRPPPQMSTWEQLRAPGLPHLRQDNQILNPTS